MAPCIAKVIDEVIRVNETPTRPITIGKYIIIGELGRGGMGVVYLAQDPDLGREIAIKVLPPELAREPILLERFRREGSLLASLNHRSIATVYSVEEFDGLHYITLEVIKGCTLAERIAAGPLDVDSTLRICRQILAALETAYGKGIIHRDLKPSNIMLTEDDHAKVLDFGLAKVIAGMPGSDVEETATGATLGTTGYASPEQLRGTQVDHRADLWSFGCILYECLTGDRLFRGNSQADQIAATLGHKPNWNSLPADCPPWLLAILKSCLAQDVTDRPASAREVRQRLSAEQHDSAGSIESSTAVGNDAKKEPAGSRHRPILRIALTALIILSALALGAFAAREYALSKLHLEAYGKLVSATAPVLGEVWSHRHESDIRVQKTPTWSSKPSIAYGLSYGWPDGGGVYVRNNRSGALMWSAQLDSTLLREAYGPKHPAPYDFNCRDIVFADLDGDSQDELIATWGHHLWAPGCAGIFSKDGTLHRVYFNPGQLYESIPLDLNQDGKEEVLLAGTNHESSYHGATLILLDWSWCSGTYADTLAHPKCAQGDDAAIRVVFPQFEAKYMDLLKQAQLAAENIEVIVREGRPDGVICFLNPLQAPLIIYLDAALRPSRVTPADAFVMGTASWPEEERRTFLSREFLDAWLATHYRYKSPLYEFRDRPETP